jgi:hypothetical protein
MLYLKVARTGTLAISGLKQKIVKTEEINPWGSRPRPFSA